MKCQEFYNQIGMNFTEISKDFFEICTPLNFLDNTPVYAYFSTEEHKVVIKDEGEILAHLRSNGQSDNTRLNSAIANKALSKNGSLVNDSVKFTGNKNQSSQIFSNFLDFAYSVIEYEKQLTKLDEKNDSIISEIESAILQRNQKAKITRDITIQGESGIKYNYPLRANNTLIDKISTHSTASGAAIRRAIDIQQSSNPILIIIDDRDCYESAKKEQNIIGRVVPAILFGDLIHGKGTIELLN